MRKNSLRFSKACSLSATLLCVCLLALLSTGCALTRTETKVQFNPSVNDPLKSDHKGSLVVAVIKDTRGVSDNYVLVQKRDGYGNVSSGAYVTKVPVAEILKNGLNDALQRNGFTGPTPKFELRGDLQEFDLVPVGGFWTAKVKPKITARFELIDNSSGRSVWHDSFTGHTTGETAWGTKDFLSEMFSKAADDLVQQLIEDKTFRGFLE